MRLEDIEKGKRLLAEHERAEAAWFSHDDSTELQRWLLRNAPALLAAAEAAAWRPISEAPRDGTKFLAFIQHNVGKATRIDIAWAPDHPEWRCSWWMIPGNVSCPIVETHKDVSDCWLITHWMPLSIGPLPTEG